MMPAHDNRELTVGEVLSQCRRMVPVNVLVPVAIEAHKEAVRQRLSAREISFCAERRRVSGGTYRRGQPATARLPRDGAG